MKKSIKITAIVLVIALIVGISINSNMFKSEASEELEVKEVVLDQISEEQIQSVDTEILEDGSSKTIVVREDGVKVVTETNIVNNSIFVTMYDVDGNILSEEVVEYNEIQEDIDDEELEEKLDVEYNENEYQADVTRASKINWNSTVKETYNNKYWYKKGNKGKKVYLRVGCNAKYQIRLDNLSSSKKNVCDKYMNTIKDVRSKMKTAKTILIGVGIASAVAIAVVAFTYALVKAGVTAVSTIVAKIKGAKILGEIALTVPVLSAITGSVGSVLGASRKYEDVKDYYVDVRSYGEKY